IRNCGSRRESGSETALFSAAKVPRQELTEPIDRIFANARENFAQVPLGLDAVGQAGADDGVEYRRPRTTGIGTGKKVILSAKCSGTDFILHGIVGDLQPAVLDVARQGDPTRARVADRLGKLAAIGNALELRIKPNGEFVEPGFGQLRSDLFAHIRRLSLNWALDVEEHADLLERLFGD